MNRNNTPIPREELITVGAPFQVENWKGDNKTLWAIPEGSTVEVIPKTEGGTYFSRVDFKAGDISHSILLDTTDKAFSPYLRREAVADLVEASDKDASQSLKNFPDPACVPKPGFPTPSRYNGEDLGLASKDAWLYGATCHGDAKAIHHYLVNEHANPFRPTEQGHTSAERAFEGKNTTVFDDRFRYQGGLLGATIGQRHDGLLKRVEAVGAFENITPSAFEVAVMKGTTLSVSTCLKHGADVEDKGLRGPILNTLFDNSGADRETHEKAKILLKAGADPSLRDEQGNTALHKASRMGNGAIEDLLSYGADANARNKEMQTPLHLALERNVDINNVHTLIEFGSDPNARDSKGRTPLHMAASNPDASTKVIDLLVNAGARLDSPDLDGNTPLHLSAQNLTDRHADRLVHFGADVHAKNGRGEIADITPANVKREASELLIRAEKEAFNPFEAKRMRSSTSIAY